VLVTGWMSESQAKRALAEARLRKQSGTGRRRMTRDEVTSLVKALGDVMRVLKDADPADKAEIYGQLGLTLTYHPNEKPPVAAIRICQGGSSRAARPPSTPDQPGTGPHPTPEGTPPPSPTRRPRTSR
jgi:hypothetical protein